MGFLKVMVIFSLCGYNIGQDYDYDYDYDYEIDRGGPSPFSCGTTDLNCGGDALQAIYMNLIPSSCRQCGISQVKPAGRMKIIINGEKVKPPFKYPFMVAIQKWQQTICGGALISEWFVLTAAHCLAEGGSGYVFNRTEEKVKYYNVTDMSVAFVTKTKEVKTGPKVQQLIPHSGFSFGKSDHDIALVKLSHRVICDKFKNPICLPTPRFNIRPRQVFTVAGWGYYMRGREETSNELLEGRVQFMPFSQCKSLPDRMKESYYCFKGVNNQSPCHGDSGGPVFYRRGGRFTLVGILSMHSDETCDPKQAFVYTAVPKHVSWIKSVTGRK